MTDLSHLVKNIEDLIRRTIGPQIKLEVIAAGSLWMTQVDQNQLENALLNLCINARDAMPGGGRVTVETANFLIDERMASESDMSPGQYVALSVSDTGSGMTREVMSRAFDPLFTTKPMGSGTGLGLSMIYGFAKQWVFRGIGPYSFVGQTLRRQRNNLFPGNDRSQALAGVRRCVTRGTGSTDQSVVDPATAHDRLNCQRGIWSGGYQ